MALIHPLVDQLLNTAHVHFETKGEEGPRDTTKKVRISSKDAAAADPWKPGAKMTAMTVHSFFDALKLLYGDATEHEHSD